MLLSFLLLIRHKDPSRHVTSQTSALLAAEPFCGVCCTTGHEGPANHSQDNLINFSLPVIACLELDCQN